MGGLVFSHRRSHLEAGSGEQLVFQVSARQHQLDAAQQHLVGDARRLLQRPPHLGGAVAMRRLGVGDDVLQLGLQLELGRERLDVLHHPLDVVVYLQRVPQPLQPRCKTPQSSCCALRRVIL
jgi:hypothetical protein